MKENEGEVAVELEADFTEMACALKAVALEEAERSCVLRVDSGDHDVLAEGARMVNEGVEKSGSDALAAGVGMNVDRAFDGEAIAGPGAEVAKGCEAEDAVFAFRDQHGVALAEAPATSGCGLQEKRAGRYRWRWSE